MTKNTSTSKYWLDIAVDEILKAYPDKNQEIILSSGISPSASYHIGHFREILTVDALTWGVSQAGRKAKHIHVVDNFDPLRKRYDFLPEDFEQYVGWPVCLIPDPKGNCHKTYADHFYSEFEHYIHKMGIRPEIVKSYEDLYKTGKMTDRFEEALTHINAIHKIFKEVSNRDLDTDWAPVQALGDDNRYFNAKLSSWDKDGKTIEGKSYSDGHAKLNWRLDWPARWKVLGVMVEPHGRELASAGSAWDTGRRFAREVFDIDPPLPVGQYETINLVGDTKKMSSSLGNLVTPKEALEIMPPEVLRYFVVRSRPDRKIHFDPGEGLYNLIDEFSQVENDPNHEYKEAYQFAVASRKGERRISDVSFKHLVFVYQAAKKDTDNVFKILERTGYKEVVSKQRDAIRVELKFIENWLKKSAPEKVKFEIQEKLPDLGPIDSKQAQFLDSFAEEIKKIEGQKVDGQWFHEKIYSLKDNFDLSPKQAFAAIYLVTLGQLDGPRAGWLLAELDQKFLIKRMKREG